MIEMKVKTLSVLIVIILTGCCLSFVSSIEGSAAENEGDLLLDYGNGRTEWIPISAKATVGNTIEKSLTDAGIDCSLSGGVFTINGVTSETIGAASTGGSVSLPGTTGITETCSWHTFSWNGSGWDAASASSSYGLNQLAIAYYPDGIVPVETPAYKTSWTMMSGDSENSLNQTISDTTQGSQLIWEVYPDQKGHAIGCYSTTLYANGYAFVKYGSSRISDPASVCCYKITDGSLKWEFNFSSNQIEMACAMIVGQRIYIQSTTGVIYAFDWDAGPGPNNENVISSEQIPDITVVLDWKSSYGQGVTSMVFDSGAIFVKSHNGMVYSFDKDLNLIWSYQMMGQAYFTSITIADNYVFSGTYDGYLYILNKNDGSLVYKQYIYQKETATKHSGCCNAPIVLKNDHGYGIIISYSDGLGMSSTVSGIQVLDFNTSTNEMTLVKNFTNDLTDPNYIGTASNLLTKYETDDFKGVIAGTGTGIYKIDVAGNKTLITDISSADSATHSSPTLVNNRLMYISTFSTQQLFVVDVDGNIIGTYKFENEWFSMATTCVVDGYIVRSDDNGVAVLTGSTLGEYTPPSVVKETPVWMYAIYVIASVSAVVIILWAFLRFVKKWEHPFERLHKEILTYFFGENYSHNTKSKRKLHAIIIIGVLVTLAVSMASLCFGSESSLTINEALSALVSSIKKGGRGLTYEELLIYNQRLPRALATICVGIGLSVAGAMYQAVIKNPLVEPYIMGVSSGAGTFAVAVLVANFTFFGLFAPKSSFLIAVSAIFGGLLAFGCTMLLAEKTGGKSINYVLAGIVVGMVFSAIQSILMIQSGTKMISALSWLYGSFANITWDKIWFIIFPVLALSFVPLIWAKEFNLILLGDDQARQMGLNAKKFNMIMLTLASILTSFCVAFCGIIGFVGLVIPHLSRMLMGGDHRLMLPVSMAFGGSLMVVADLLSRVLLTGYELPVGAITTVIGVPMFIYLLVKRGGRYDA